MLICSNVTKKYNRTLFYNLNYEFKEGNIYSLIGKSGTGKSTLLSFLSGINKNYKGFIYYNGKDIKKLKNYSFNDVSYIYQNNKLFARLTVYENIIFPFTITNTKHNEYKLLTLVKRFEIEGLLKKKINKLSGGELQRVAIVRGLLKDSKVILLDEPTSALDERMTNILYDYLYSIKNNHIIIMISHNKQIYSKSDYIVDLTNLDKNINLKIDKKNNIHENKIKFVSQSSLSKSLFSNKKIFDYLLTSILTLGLTGFFLSSLISSFINELSTSSLDIFKTSEYVTFKSNSPTTYYDFKEEKVANYDYVYYEGIQSDLKTTLKLFNPIDCIYFNSRELEVKSFIYDNYMSLNETGFTLFVPIDIYKGNLATTNKLTINIDNKSFEIPIDNLYPNDTDTYEIYCNDFSYLNNVFTYLNVSVPYTSYFYSVEAYSMYNYLNSSELYSSYTFYLDSTNRLILINKLESPRITNNQISNLDNSKLILSDNIHTYIDYETGFMYLVENNELTQIVIDNEVPDNKVNISKKYASLIEDNSSLKIFNKYYQVNSITTENNYILIYMNINTFNSFNNKEIFSGAYYNTTKIENSYLVFNYNLFSISSIEIFNYITDFINLFSIIVLGLATIASCLIFIINFNFKELEIKSLIKLGIYKKEVIKLIVYNPVINYLTSFASSLFASLLVRIILKKLYLSDYGVNLALNVDYIGPIVVSLAPFALLLLIIYIKIVIFNKKTI